MRLNVKTKYTPYTWAHKLPWPERWYRMFGVMPDVVKKEVRGSRCIGHQYVFRNKVNDHDYTGTDGRFTHVPTESD